MRKTNDPVEVHISTEQAKSKPVNTGRLFVEKYKKKFRNRDKCLEKGKCCYTRCKAPSASTFMGFPFCDFHGDVWLEKILDKLCEDEIKRRS